MQPSLVGVTCNLEVLLHAGLDARAAAIVMRTVRNIVDTGRTIVCTIHQPSIDIFESFDELLLLKRGGQTIYAGQPCSGASPSPLSSVAVTITCTCMHCCQLLTQPWYKGVLVLTLGLT